MKRLHTWVLAILATHFVFGASVASAGWPFRWLHHHGYALGQPQFVSMGFAQPAQAPQQAIDIGLILTLLDRFGRGGSGGGGGGFSSGDLSGLKSEVATLSSKLSSLESQVKTSSDDLRGRVDNMAGTLESLGKNSVEVTARVTKIQAEVATLKDLVQASKQTVQAADDLSNALKDVNDEIKTDLFKDAKFDAFKGTVKKATTKFDTLKDLLGKQP